MSKRIRETHQTMLAKTEGTHTLMRDQIMSQSAEGVNHLGKYLMEGFGAVLNAIPENSSTPKPFSEATLPPTKEPTTPDPTISPTYSIDPSCGNGECELDETRENCHFDCLGAELVSLPASDVTLDKSSPWIIFTLVAARNVEVKSISFYTKNESSNSGIKVEIAQGDQANEGALSWNEEVFHGGIETYQYNNSQKRLSLLNYQHIVPISSGQSLSFRVSFLDSNEIMYVGDEQIEGTPYQDNALELLVGKADGDDSSVFNGIVIYDGVELDSHQSLGFDQSRLEEYDPPHLFNFDITWPGGNNPIEALMEIKQKENDVMGAVNEVKFALVGLGDKIADIETNSFAQLSPLPKSGHVRKIESIEGKVDAIESKVNAMEGKIIAMEDKMGAKIDAMEDKIIGIDGKIDALEDKMGALVDMFAKLVG